MPKGYVIPEEEKKKIYTAHCLGETNADIAERLGLSPVTVRRIVREERKAYDKEMAEMARSGKIVKKDGRGGKLMALPVTGFEFTHVTPDGKSHKKKVEGHVSCVAERQYDQWCQELDDECEFMRKVERKPEPAEEPKVVCGYPGDPIEEIHSVEPAPVPEINVRPWRDVAEERQRRIEELEAQVERLMDELDEAKAQRIDFAEGFQIEQHNPSYLIWAKGEEARVYGLYLDEEQALLEVDRLNEVAAFLGSDGAFEVEEVSWK